MLFQIKENIRNLIICLFMAKKNDIKKNARADFSPEEYHKKHIANSSIITMFQNEDNTLFFRECRLHSPMKHYLNGCIEDYFDNICECNNKEELKVSVLKDISKKENYKKAIRITEIFNNHLMEILAGIYNDYSAIGFDCFAKPENKKEFLPFIKYISCAVISQKTNAYLKNGKLENFNANKQLSTYHLARLLEIDQIIPAVWTCCFNDGANEKVGTMMDKADGMPPSDILPKDRQNFVKSTFLKDITNLEYFDALCYQLDHRLDNYYVTKDKSGRIDHVVAFDNDAARTFFISPYLPQKTYADATCVLSKNKTVARPYMDKAFGEKLLSISKKDIKAAVGEYLSSYQLYCLNQRIGKLKKAIKKTIKQRSDFLVSNWETVDPKNAASSQWGKTYFDLYLHDTLMFDRKIQFEEMKNKA